MEKGKKLIKLRIDVDYPYPSRFRSFIYTTLGMKCGGDYLKNSKIIAKMINDSPKEVKAYWFFTPKTFPDLELLKLLDNSRHEIALHVANDPYKELKMLEKLTGKKVNYYTVHGTARLLARLMWKRWNYKSPPIPENYPLQSFYQFLSMGLDVICYRHSVDEAVKMAEVHVKKGYALHIHPIWLFQRGKINYRGRFYEALRRILDVDRELETVTIRKKLFFRIARDAKEYERDIVPTEKFISKIRDMGIDIFTFIERKWCSTLPNLPNFWVKGKDNVALLRVTSFEEWWKNIGKKTRNMIRKAEKSGIRTETVEPSEKLAEDIWKIYNETPIRQERGFPHYGKPFEAVRKMVSASDDNIIYVGAYLQDELVGFVQLVKGENIAIISQILSLQRHWDKAINNALIAKTVEVCATRQIPWIMYGRMGNHPSLDKFKENNGFTQFHLTRYYIPLSRKGKIAIKLGLHTELKDVLPQPIKYPLIPVYNWISRTKTRIKLRLKQK